MARRQIKRGWRVRRRPGTLQGKARMCKDTKEVDKKGVKQEGGKGN